MKKIVSLFIVLMFAVPVFAETVVYNTNTGKYHKPSCASAVKCTKNCIKIDKKQAIKKGGQPCKKCGG